jgi:hypothetical protein
MLIIDADLLLSTDPFLVWKLIVGAPYSMRVLPHIHSTLDRSAALLCTLEHHFSGVFSLTWSLNAASANGPTSSLRRFQPKSPPLRAASSE